MSEDLLREQLRGQIKNRAMMYYHIYKEMSAEIGPEKAVGIMKKAIYKRGLEIGRALAGHGPDDLEGLKDTFISKLVPDEGRMYSPEILGCCDQGLDIQFHSCPLKEAYEEAGLSGEEMALMLDIASQVDYGTFEGAGFKFNAETWQPGRTGCCRLHIKRGE